MEAFGVESSEIENINRGIKLEMKEAAKKAQFSCEPEPYFDAKAPLPQLAEMAKEYTGCSTPKQLTMLEAMRKVLHDQMQQQHWK